MKRVIFAFAVTAALFSACGGEEKNKTTQEECARESARVVQELIKKLESEGYEGVALSGQIVLLREPWIDELVFDCGYTREEAVALTGG